MPADILIYAIVAAGLVFWLRNILGTRHGDEQHRPNPFTSQSAEKSSPAQEKKSQKKPQDIPGMLPGLYAYTEGELDPSMSVEGEEAERGLVEIAQANRSFDLQQFLSGAQEAFATIVEAFAASDKDTLKKLLSAPVYTAFENIIDEREKNDQKASVEILAIRKTEVVNASLQNRMARITVRFVADETNVLYDKAGEPLSGNPDRVTETVDIWTFEQKIRSRDPVWYLCETRDEDVKDGDHKTVPDSETE